VSKLWEWTAVPSVPVTAKAMLPSTSAVTITLGGGVSGFGGRGGQGKGAGGVEHRTASCHVVAGMYSLQSSL
jgi:hypothetical protein